MNTVSSGHIEFCEKLSKVKMLLPEQMQKLLCTVKEIGSSSSLEEVMDGMKHYIYKNRLFDQKHPRVVHCANDPLKDVLGVDEFTLYEIRKLVTNVLVFENRNRVQELIEDVKNYDINNKRKAGEAAEVLDEATKRRCGESSNSQSPVDMASVDEGLGSMKEEICLSEKEDSVEDDVSNSGSNDSEGLLNPLAQIIAFQETYDIEYEPESDASVSEGSVTDSSSDFDLAETVEVVAISQLLNLESDTDLWADQSSEESDCDIELSKLDEWRCNTCGSFNKPVVRYCLRCWEERTGWLDTDRAHPPRHKTKKNKKKGASANREAQEQRDSGFSSLESCTSIGNSQAASLETCSSQASSQETCNSKQESQTNDSNLCILCCAKPKNSVIVHGKVGHQIACYRCARRLLSMKESCPVCRTKIERVLHHIM